VKGVCYTDLRYIRFLPTEAWHEKSVLHEQVVLNEQFVLNEQSVLHEKSVLHKKFGVSDRERTCS